MRGASISFTCVAVLLSSHTQPGRLNKIFKIFGKLYKNILIIYFSLAHMDPEVFPSEPLVGSELGLTLSSPHYRHLDLLQSVAEEPLAIYRYFGIL